MFILRDEPTFKQKVRIQDPTMKAFHKTSVEIEVEYLVASPETITDAVEAALAARRTGEGKVEDAVLILAGSGPGEGVVRGWSGIKIDDKDGEDFPFSDENLRRLINIPYVRSAILDGYFEGVNGKARRGN